MFPYIETLYYLCCMRRTIIAYGDYVNEFIGSLSDDVAKKFYYAFTILETQEYKEGIL